MTERLLLYSGTSLDPYYNLAVEEQLLENVKGQPMPP